MNKALRKAVIAGNWKMNKTRSEAAALIKELGPLVKDADCEVAVCVPFIDLETALAVTASDAANVKVGAENCHWAVSGAFTGEVAAPMLAEMGVYYVVIGHSERRQYFGETDQTVNQRVRAALDAGLHVILCVGELEAQREYGITEEIVGMQTKVALHGVSADELKRIIIAYEPVWAIGPGKTPPDRAYIQMIAQYIKEVSGGMDVVYGGGLKVDNAEMLASIPEVDGGLIALTRFTGEIGFYPDEYLEIIKTYLGF